MIDNKEPWKTKNWFVSPWDYADEVMKNLTPPPRVTVEDLTLRDGEQQAGIMFKKDEKIRIAEKLAEAGVQRIEAGTPAVSPHDEAAVREIVKRKLGFQVFCCSRCAEVDIKRAADCGVVGVNISVPGSKLLMELGYNWSWERAAETAIKGSIIAHEQGLHVSFAGVDGTRADLEWYLNFHEMIVKQGHVDSLTLLDTMGSMNPEAVAYIMKKLRERIKIPIQAHFHNDYGLAVANTIKAVLCGAEVIQTTVNGIGERSGNAPMEETSLALKTLYGIDVGSIRETSRTRETCAEGIRDTDDSESGNCGRYSLSP